MLPPARIVYSLPVSLYKSLFFSYLIAMSFNFPNIIETVFCVQICVRPCWECKGEWYRVLYSQGSLSSVSVYMGRFLALLGFRLEFAYCCEVSVSVRLWLK